MNVNMVGQVPGGKCDANRTLNIEHWTCFESKLRQTTKCERWSCNGAKCIPRSIFDINDCEFDTNTTFPTFRVNDCHFRQFHIAQATDVFFFCFVLLVGELTAKFMTFFHATIHWWFCFWPMIWQLTVDICILVYVWSLEFRYDYFLIISRIRIPNSFEWR